METLTLAHLAPYLPYRLRVQTSLNEVYLLEGLVSENAYLSGLTYPADIFAIKPILRPMSDFDEPLGNDSDFYSYLSKCRKECNFQNRVDVDRDLDFNIEDSDSTYFNLSEGLKLYDFIIQNHFDYNGLIEKGLAISIHDVK